MSWKITTLLTGVCILGAGAFAKYYAPPPADEIDWDVHDDGLLWLKVWNNGAVGDQMDGSGVYPAPNGPANIYQAEFWFGTKFKNEPERSRYYVVTPHYGLPPYYGWRGLTPVIMSRDPEWPQRPGYVKQEGTLDSYYRMYDAHAGEQSPIAVTCDVHGISWNREEYDDFIGFRYRLINDAKSPLEDVYMALVYDFDVGGSVSYIDDYVGFDDERKMPYVYDGDASHPYLGLVCVNGGVRGAHSWDIMNDPDTDRYKYAYMEDPSFKCTRTKPYDWRVMLSTGPYEVRGGLTEVVTFAVVAGADLEELQNNADAAAEAFARTPQPEPARPSAFRLFQNRPNPVEVSTKITFACATRAKVELAVYDVAGRRVATLADRVYDAGVHELEWAPVGVPPGVYLYEMKAAGERSVKTMVVAR
jgi:hypothetical protein